MMNASFKGHYNTDKSGAVGTFVVNGGDVRLKTSITEATFADGLSLSGLALSVEKPGSFIIDYDIPKQDVRFQFMNRVRILEKQLNLTYTHMRGDNKTSLDGTLVIDDVNKVSMNYGFDTGNCKLKYSYVHGGVRTFEPTYDFAKNSWDFAVSQRVYGDDVVRASYQSFSRVVGVEWSRPSGLNGAFKITASLNLAEESKIPKLCAESTWNVEL